MDDFLCVCYIAQVLPICVILSITHSRSPCGLFNKIRNVCALYWIYSDKSDYCVFFLLHNFIIFNSSIHLVFALTCFSFIFLTRIRMYRWWGERLLECERVFTKLNILNIVTLVGKWSRYLYQEICSLDAAVYAHRLYSLNFVFLQTNHC